MQRSQDPALAELLAMLDIEPFEAHLFRGRTPESAWKRVFGGHVLAQALIAACRTLSAPHRPHSLHAYFLLAGEAGRPIVYDVERIRDGRSFSTRRVLGLQHGEAIFSMDVSFQGQEPGLDHQTGWPVAPPPAPPDEDAASSSFPPGPFAGLQTTPIEALNAAAPPSLNEWCRFTGALPPAPEIHLALLAWASDLAMLPVARRPLADSFAAGPGMGASLDHSLWFHRPFRLDDWFYAHRRTTRVEHERYLVEGQYFSRDGDLLASVFQESLNRPAV